MSMINSVAGRVPRRITGAQLIFISLCTMLFQFRSVAAQADQLLEKSIRIDIAANTPVEEALIEWGLQAGMSVLINTATISGHRTVEIRGVFRAEDALSMILLGTGLAFTTEGNRVRIVPIARLKKSSREETPHVATQGDMVATLVSSASDASARSRSDQLDQVVVTAQKREERLVDVPNSASAMSGERLEELEINSLSDLSDYVPGASIVSGGAPGYRMIVLRGLSTGYNNPGTAALVGTYIDDLPVGDSSAGARGSQYGLDLNPYDIDQIEVLKGPQGTLYGANTMGGLIKYSLRQPNLENAEARIGADTEDIDGGGRLGWGVRGAVSTPIIADTLGFRFSGFYKNNAGYIDNVAGDDKDINSSKTCGGNATLIWHPTDRLTVHAFTVVQDVNAANLSTVTLDGNTRKPLFGPLTLDAEFPEPYTQHTRVYSFGFNLNLNFATLIDIAGRSQIKKTWEQDLSVPFASFCAPGSLYAGSPGCPDYQQAALAPFFLNDSSNKFVDELRLTSPENQRFQWMLGAFFTREADGEIQDFPTYTASYVPLPVADELLLERLNTTYKEYAGFVNATYLITDSVDIGAGSRYSRYSIVSCIPQNDGQFGSPLTPCSELPATGVAVWMGNIRYHVSSNNMLYARVATGYRPGSGCPSCGVPALNIPGEVDPDRTINYEAGFKGEFWENRLQLELSVFHILWNGIQLNLEKDGLTYPGNGSTATSDGFEFTATQRPLQGLLLNATLAYTNARLTQDAPAAYGDTGDQLPGSPRWTGSLAVDYTRSVSDTLSLIFGGSYRYRDGLENQFAHTPRDQGGPLPIGPQDLVDLYAGATWKKFTFRLYVANVFNKLSYAGLIFVSDPSKPQFVPIQPRTLMLSVDYQF